MSSAARFHRPALFVLTAAAALAGATLCGRDVRAAQGPAAAPTPDSPQFYTQEVQPIFAANCYRCHGGMNHRGGLHLDSREGLLRGGDDGEVIVPGHPEQSLLVTLIRRERPNGDPPPMPPRSKLPDADVATIVAWIRAGAVMPADQSPVSQSPAGAASAGGGAAK